MQDEDRGTVDVRDREMKVYGQRVRREAFTDAELLDRQGAILDAAGRRVDRLERALRGVLEVSDQALPAVVKARAVLADVMGREVDDEDQDDEEDAPGEAA